MLPRSEILTSPVIPSLIARKRKREYRIGVACSAVTRTVPDFLARSVSDGRLALLSASITSSV
jgi:hypothetical protein